MSSSPSTSLVNPSGPPDDDGLGVLLGWVGSSDGMSGTGSAELAGGELAAADRDGVGESLGAGMKVRVGLGRALRVLGLAEGSLLDGDGDGERVGLTDGNGMIGEGCALALGEDDGEGVGAACTAEPSRGSRTSEHAASSAPLRRTGMAASVRRPALPVMTTWTSAR